MKSTTLSLQSGSLRLRHYLQLAKPRVVSLIVFCAVIGMFLAVPGMVPWRILVAGTQQRLSDLAWSLLCSRLLGTPVAAACGAQCPCLRTRRSARPTPKNSLPGFSLKSECC